MRSVCVVGDDAQLPPVTTLAPLGVSALTYLQGMNTYQNIPIPESRRIILQEQYRMHPAIAQLTERLLNNTRTVIPSGSTTSEDYLLPIDFYNLYNLPGTYAQSTSDMLDDILNPRHALVIIDTSDIPEALDTTVGRSRLNLIEGQIAIGLYNALRFAYDTPNNENFSDEDIILTAPYRQQVNFFIRNNVRTGTVHQFQGQEAETVIYSLTFARPGAKSEFFSQLELMYVGLSRAKRKLIILGNRDAINYPDPAIQHVRNIIFNFQYISGGQGYPTYDVDPVCHKRINEQFLTDIINNLL
jgi:superfamily I DNA and/or RNA helicase